MNARAARITQLLQEWQTGSANAFEEVVPLVYDELRAIASRHLAREWRHNHLQTTVVVNEAYLRLFDQKNVDWQNRGHFFAVAATLMRRILVDHARSERRQKRGAGSIRVTLDDSIPAGAPSLDDVDALDLDRALEKLQQIDPDEAKIVELRFFGGLTLEETAAATGISVATVKREWSIAKGWLHRELAGTPAGDARSPPA